MRLRSSQGEVVRGRCRATNQCAYCARLAAVENSELLALDAVASGSAPSVWTVLTTRTATDDPRPFYRARELVLRALRRRWPACEYAALVEFTTGYGPRSGGARRPHWNLLLKGIPADALDQAGDVIRRVWCRHVDAEPWAQFVGHVDEVGGLLRYVALHFQKESQAPPAGWSGQRFNVSRGYLAGSTAEARAAARESLAFKRELWKAIRDGATGTEAEARARELRAIAAATTWELVNATRLVTATTRGVTDTDSAEPRGGTESPPRGSGARTATPAAGRTASRRTAGRMREARPAAGPADCQPQPPTDGLRSPHLRDREGDAAPCPGARARGQLPPPPAPHPSVPHDGAHDGARAITDRLHPG